MKFRVKSNLAHDKKFYILLTLCMWDYYNYEIWWNRFISLIYSFKYIETCWPNSIWYYQIGTIFNQIIWLWRRRFHGIRRWWRRIATTNLSIGTSIYTFCFITILLFAKCFAFRTCIDKITYFPLFKTRRTCLSCN